MDLKRKNDKIMLFADIALALVTVAGIAAGTYGDLDIAGAVYSPDSIFWRIFTILGMYPFMAIWVFYVGVICRQVRSSGLPEKKKNILTVVCGYLGLSTSVICSWAMFASDTIGAVFPQTINNPLFISAGALLGIYPLFFVGFFTSKKEYDKKLLKRLIILCAIMLAGIIFMSAGKMIFCRPRYRLLLQDIPGIEFCPWYLPFGGSAEYINGLGIDWNDFRSFPSGHALQSMGMIFALPPLADVYDRLRDRKAVLFAAAALFAVLVCFSRMVMGAHFISDVSMGSLISVLLAFADRHLSETAWVNGNTMK